jgi:hypothetical protein
VIKKLAPQGGVSITRCDGARFVCCANGKIVYVPKTVPAELFPKSLSDMEYEEHGLPRECYTFDLVDGTLDCHDNEDNLFHAGLDGKWETKLPREQGVSAGDANMLAPKFFPPPENPVQPRVFVVRGDMSGYELLSPQAVSNYVDFVSKNSNCRELPAESFQKGQSIDNVNRMDMDGLNGEVSEPMSLKFLETLPTPTAYTRVPVIPNIVKAAPSVFNNNDKPGHQFIVFRHLIREPRISAEERKQIIEEKEFYLEWKADLAQTDLDFLTDDPRPAEEIEEEKRLQIEVMTARARRKEMQMTATLSEHEQTVQEAASRSVSRSSPLDVANVGATLPSVYDPPKKKVVTTLPMTQINDDGTAGPVKFFNKKSGRKTPPKIPKPRADAGDTALKRRPKGKETPETIPYFENKNFDQRFAVKEVLRLLRMSCHPLYQEGMEHGELQNAIADLSDADREVKDNYFYGKILSVANSLQHLVNLVSRIFHRPHDPTLRTVDLSREPYAAIVDGSPIVARFAKPLLSALGFKDNGIMVLMKDDLFVKDGIKVVTSTLKSLARRPTVAQTQESAPRYEYSDDEEDLDATIVAPIDEIPRTKAYLEREARMKANLSNPTVHGRDSFNYEAFNHFGPPGPEANKVSLDKVAVGTGTLNINYINRESAVKRPTKTTSTFDRVMIDPTAPFTDFEFEPSQMWFGEMRQGNVYRMTCSLKNVGVEPGKFQVRVLDEEEGSTSTILQTYVRPGPLAPGMKKRIDVQVYADSEGDFVRQLEVRTEKATFTVPITGTIVAARPSSSGLNTTGSGRMATRSPHHVPPLETKDKGRFGKVGQVRLHSNVASPRTRNILKQRERSQEVKEPEIPELKGVEGVEDRM